MNNNEIRDEIQNKAVELALKHQNYIAEFATGVGKSLVAIKIIELIDVKWNIVVAETNHIKNWEDEFIKHDKKHLLKRVKMFCYASLHKHTKGTHYIFDEIHHLLLSEKRLQSLEKIIKSNLIKFIGLSATLNKTMKINLERLVPNIFYHKLHLSNAININLLPEPVVYLIGIKLDTEEKKYTFAYSNKKSINCTQKEWYDLQEKRIEYLKKVYFTSRQEWDKIKWLRAGGSRKKFLSDIKTPHAKGLLNSLKDKRLICFTHSINQSEQLSKGNSIHSNISTELRKEMIEDFNSGKINKLFTTKMLREGMNLNNIEAGVMLQLDNNLKSFVQTMGRVLRSKTPEYYIMYVENTQDEKYLKTALDGFDSKFIRKININSLTYHEQ